MARVSLSFCQEIYSSLVILCLQWEQSKASVSLFANQVLNFAYLNKNIWKRGALYMKHL